MEPLRILIISDGTGNTATSVVRAVLAQFENIAFQFTRFKNVRSEAQIEGILKTSANHHMIIVHTIVTDSLREFIRKKCMDLDFQAVDLIGPLISKVENLVHQQSKGMPGILHAINDSYFSRIEAMEFAVRADDGKNYKMFEKADIVLVGISRTSKTPLSIYLSHHGYKVANLPLVKGVPIPPEVDSMDQSKFVGLTIDPEALYEIRQQRIKNIGSPREGDYASMETILEEIQYAEKIFASHKRWPVFNVTGKALEEIAFEITRIMEERRNKLQGIR